MGAEIKRQYTTLADDATLTVPFGNAGIVLVDNANTGDGVFFFADYDSGTTVKVADPSGVGGAGDLDGYMCFYTSENTTNHTFKNRRGGSYTYEFRIFG